MTAHKTIQPYPADDHDHHDSLNDLGLQADTNMMSRTLLDRRRVLGLGLLGAAALLVGCGTVSTPTSSSGSDTGTGSGSSSGSTGTESCPTAIPSETAGPYPADGSVASGQSVNALTRSGIQRTNLKSSTTTGTTVGGIPLTLTLKLVNTNASCAALSGYAVYVWHCTADGKYSLYSTGLTNEDFLRGVATTGTDGTVTFQTILPGCYAGRWPHIHFEVYPSLSTATSASNKIQTSQIALPQDVCTAAYATTGYTGSASNLNAISLSSDNVFSDGYSTQLLTVTGSTSAGYTGNIVVGLAR